MKRCIFPLLFLILGIFVTVQGYKKATFEKGGYYGHKFRQPLKIMNPKLAYYSPLSISSGLYGLPSLHNHNPFSLSPYTLHKKMKTVAKNGYYNIPGLYRQRTVDIAKEPSSKTLIWDSSKRLFVRPGEIKTLKFDAPDSPFNFDSSTGHPKFSIHTRTYSPKGGHHHKHLFVDDGKVQRLTEHFPNVATQSEPLIKQNTDNGINFDGADNVFTGNDRPNPAVSVTDSAGLGIPFPIETSINAEPNAENIITTSGQLHLTHLPETSASTIPMMPDAGSTISASGEIIPLAETTGQLPSNATVGIDVTQSLGISGTSLDNKVHVDTRLPQEGLPISFDLFNSAFINGLKTPGLKLDASLNDVGGVRSISATDAIVVDTNQFINGVRDVNLISGVAINPAISVVDFNERQENSDLTRDSGVAIINGQTAVPVSSIENPFLEPMEHMGAFGPGPYYTCHPPSRVICNANSDWYSVTGIDEWCQQNCVVDNYSSYCDDDRCSCKCVESE